VSGYNKNTELYELTATKAKYYCRTPDCPSLSTNMEFYANKLTAAGFNVVRVHNTWLEVDASESQIFGCLSGRPGR